MRQSVRRRAQHAPKKELPPIYLGEPPGSAPPLEVAPLPEAPSPSVAPPSGTDDWSDPASKPRMSALVPLLWLAVPLAGCILYGFLSSQWGGP